MKNGWFLAGKFIGNMGTSPVNGAVDRKIIGTSGKIPILSYQLNPHNSSTIPIFSYFSSKSQLNRGFLLQKAPICR